MHHPLTILNKFPIQFPFSFIQAVNPKEFFDEPSLLLKKIEQTAELIKKSKHFIAFTGAGISTACGIPDYRSGKDTVLETGPGTWVKKALQMQKQELYNARQIHYYPSFTHRALVKFEQLGLLKALISQNTDGLHVLSGFDQKKLCELHGNINYEKCSKCNELYLRDIRTRDFSNNPHDHTNGRFCDNPQCKGILVDTIVNFGLQNKILRESLPKQVLEKSFFESKHADLCLILGSSLLVSPAKMIPKNVLKNKQSVVIVNLQTTPLDIEAQIKVHSFCDEFMKGLTDCMAINVSDFQLNRFLQFQKNEINGSQRIQFIGLTKEGFNYQWFKSITLEYNGKKEIINSAPFEALIPKNNAFDKIKIGLEFFGNYQESSYQFEIKQKSMKAGKDYLLGLNYNLQNKQWTRI